MLQQPKRGVKCRQTSLSLLLLAPEAPFLAEIGQIEREWPVLAQLPEKTGRQPFTATKQKRNITAGDGMVCEAVQVGASLLMPDSVPTWSNSRT